MDICEAIYARRSVRVYADAPVSTEILNGLLQAAVQAPTAMNGQPWAFGVLQTREAVRALGDRAKAHLLAHFDEMPWLARYEGMLKDPDFDLTYNAPAMVIIYATAQNPMAELDCHLAANTLMLAAVAEGLGTCWIGFAGFLLNTPELKAEFGLPADVTAVAPLVIGTPADQASKAERTPPTVLFWK